MHIKKVIIEGFKSYRDKTVVEFLPGLNVIVGLNGSGKSNLFYAIQFVLSHEFYHLPKAQRESMLHSSAGHRAASAFVEIVFNNEDKRIPDAGSEVRLRRDISPSHDIYTLNQRQILASQLISTLQSAGLSKVNPYYIIKQGKINELAMASDAKRLQLFCEIAGSMVWAEKRPEDVKLLDETNRQIEQYRYFMDKNDETVKELDIQRRELEEWKSLEGRRHALELISLKKDRLNVKHKLVKYKGELTELWANSRKLTENLQQVKEKETTQRNVYESMRYESESTQERIKHLEQKFQESTSRLCQLNMRIEDRDMAYNQFHGTIESKRAELSRIEEEIQRRQQQLTQINSHYESLTQTESELNTKILLKEQNRLQLYVKEGRKTQFNSREERDQWIKSEMEALNSLGMKEHRQLVELKKEIEGLRIDEGRLKLDIRNLEAEKDEATRSFVEENQTKKTYSGKLKRYETMRQDLWRDESEILQRVKVATDKVESAIKAVRQVVPGPIVNGLESVRIVLQEMRAEGEEMRRLASGYRGLLVELFRCDEALLVAVDVVAGNRLFFHVVDSDAVASEIVRRINASKLPGTVNFFPLNRMLRKQIDYPLLDRIVPMISNLAVRQGMEAVLENVFNRVLVCQDAADIYQVAREFRFDCVTLGGDLVRSNGILSGGYISKKRLRIPLYEAIRQSKISETKEKEKLEQIRNKLDIVDSQITKVFRKCQQAETKMTRLKIDEMRASLTSAREKLAFMEQRSADKLKLFRQIQLSRKSNEAKYLALSEELKQDINSQLLPAERQALQALDVEIANLTTKFKIVSIQREELESKKNKTESRLNNYLLKMRSELREAIRTLQVDEGGVGCSQTFSGSQSTELQEERDTLSAEVEQTNRELETARAKIQELSDELGRVKTEIDALKTERRALESASEEHQDRINQLIQLISRYEAEDIEFSNKVLQYASVTDEQLLLFDKLSDSAIQRELQKVNNRQKNMHVNQKADLEYTFHREKQIELSDKYKQFQKNHEECWALMSSVDVQKDDALQHTFATVAHNFRTIFGTLVPEGRAFLKWSYSDNDSNDEGNECPPDVTRLAGISIQVSFTSSGNFTHLNSLSGGQRSLVSLALVFAILMLDRAPFYLLDEADMALDKTHRKSVAELISKFSQCSQFIVTTFRPELLPYAERIIGVTYQENQTSRAVPVLFEEADDFIRQDSQILDSSHSTLP